MLPLPLEDLSPEILRGPNHAVLCILIPSKFPPLCRQIRDLLQEWKIHQISLLGRVASVKMTILPKLLYLFQTLPIPVPYVQLRKLQADLVRFVWNYRRHRIPRSVLIASDGRLAEGAAGIPRPSEVLPSISNARHHLLVPLTGV